MCHPAVCFSILRAVYEEMCVDGRSGTEALREKQTVWHTERACRHRRPLEVEECKAKESTRTSTNDSFASQDIRNMQKSEMKDEQNAENEDELLEEEVAADRSATENRSRGRQMGGRAVACCAPQRTNFLADSTSRRVPLFSPARPHGPPGGIKSVCFCVAGHRRLINED